MHDGVTSAKERARSRAAERDLDRLGVTMVPDGWKLSTVGNACTIRNDLRMPLSVETRSAMQGEYPYYGPTGVLDYLDEFRAEGEFALIGEDGDHFLDTAKKNQTVRVSGRFNVNNHAHLIASGKSCAVDWFFHFFRHRDISHSLTRQGAGRYKLTKQALEKLPILLPPLPEQRKIAEILRTWDEALEKLTALRAAKARRLAGVGRALLARAADDPATVTKPLATLTRIVKGQQLNKLDISDGDYPVWNGGITPSGFHNEWNTEGGTITISEGGNSCGFVNLAHRPFWLGGHCYALQDLSQVVERDFLFHKLKSREAEIMRLRVGSGLPNIQRADLERLPVVVPPRDLQEKIASALTAGNAELALLDAEIEALTRQKRGLMQKLLTGEWRVNTTETTEVAQ